MAANNNPYAPPAARVEDHEDRDFEPVRLFRRGRIGRVRYLGWLLGLPLVLTVVSAMLAGVTASVLGVSEATIMVIVFAPTLIAAWWITLKRANDFDATGWWACLVFVPIAVIYFALRKGSPGNNRFGKPSPPNRTTEIVSVALAWFVALIIIWLAWGMPNY